MIPPNVDPDVFAQLPAELQQELRAEFSSTIASQSEDNMTERTHIAEGPLTSRISFPCKNKAISQTEAILDKTSQCNPSGSETEQPGSSLLSGNGIPIPPDVDPDVFEGLPSDMQKELIEEWRQKTKQSNLDSKKFSSHDKGKMKCKSRKSISDYFGK